MKDVSPKIGNREIVDYKFYDACFTNYIEENGCQIPFIEW